jgi:hypothetical protein
LETSGGCRPVSKIERAVELVACTVVCV